MSTLTTKIGLDAATIRRAIQEYVYDRQWIMAVDLKLNLNEDDVSAGRVELVLSSGDLINAVKLFVSRETVLAPVKVEWLIASDSHGKRCDSCLVVVETPKAPPRDIIPLPPQACRAAAPVACHPTITELQRQAHDASADYGPTPPAACSLAEGQTSAEREELARHGVEYQS